MLQTATKSTTLVSLATFKQWIGWTSGNSKSISALSSVGTIATATCAGHGYKTGQQVVIAGSATAGYNGEYLITVVDANTFTFNLAAVAASPATGTITTTLDDGRYAAMVDAACAEIERLAGIYFVLRSVTEYRDGGNATQLALRQTPIGAITSLTDTGSGLVFSASQYILERDTGVITLTDGSGFTAGQRNIVAVYTSGFDVQDGAALPSEAVRAVVDLAKAINDELVAGAIAASSISLGPSAMVIKPSQYPQSVKRVIDMFAGDGWAVN